MIENSEIYSMRAGAIRQYDAHPGIVMSLRGKWQVTIGDTFWGK